MAHSHDSQAPLCYRCNASVDPVEMEICDTRGPLRVPEVHCSDCAGA